MKVDSRVYDIYGFMSVKRIVISRLWLSSLICESSNRINPNKLTGRIES